LLILHGPNLNLLGSREPDVYGTMTLAQLDRRIRAHARAGGVEVRTAQANGEGELIDRLHAARRWADGVVFNPGAYTHYSYALRDAVAAIGIPVIEVHLSDIRRREKFRRISVIAPACRAQISGHGWESYTRAIDWLTGRVPVRTKKGRG
jgi:3-dehydroquinate dehydratase-2